MSHYSQPTDGDGDSVSPQKGCGYHLDLLMVAVMLGVCSIMGLPKRLTIGFGRLPLTALKRRPSPPAIIIAFK